MSSLSCYHGREDIWSSKARKLSAVSSIVVIGKAGWVQNFLNQHNKKLSKASLLGKICVAVSVLPVTSFTFFLYVFYQKQKTFHWWDDWNSIWLLIASYLQHTLRQGGRSSAQFKSPKSAHVMSIIKSSYPLNMLVRCLLRGMIYVLGILRTGISTFPKLHTYLRKIEPAETQNPRKIIRCALNKGGRWPR